MNLCNHKTLKMFLNLFLLKKIKSFNNLNPKYIVMQLNNISNNKNLDNLLVYYSQKYFATTSM